MFRSEEQDAAVTGKERRDSAEASGVNLIGRHSAGSVWMADWETLQMPRDQINRTRQARWRERQVAKREAGRN